MGIGIGLGLGVNMPSTAGVSAPPPVAPTINSSATSNAAENQTAIITATTSAGDTPITWSINGGVDAGLVSIDSGTGVVTFDSAPDYEAPGDNGGDNVYNFNIRATNAAGFDQQSHATTVTDVDDTIAVVQTATLIGDQIGDGTDSVAFASDVTAGSFLLVMGTAQATDSNTQALTSVTDTQGNTWVVDTNTRNVGDYQVTAWMAYCASASAGATTVTLNTSSDTTAVDITACIVEVKNTSGFDTGGRKTGFGDGTADVTLATTGTLQQANNINFAVYGGFINPDSHSPAFDTVIFDQQNGVGGILGGYCGYNAVSATTAIVNELTTLSTPAAGAASGIAFVLKEG